MTTKIIFYVCYNKNEDTASDKITQENIVSKDLLRIMGKSASNKNRIAELLEKNPEITIRTIPCNETSFEKNDFNWISIAPLLYEHIDMVNLIMNETAFETTIRDDDLPARRTCFLISTITNQLIKTKRQDEYKYGSWKAYRNGDTFLISSYQNTSSLKSISLPQSLEKINAYAVSSCPELEEITVPSSVIKIEQGFLADCAALQSICVVKDSYADTYFHSEENKRWSNPDAEKLIKYMVSV